MNNFNFVKKRVHKTDTSDETTLIKLTIVKGGKLKDGAQTHHLRVSFTPLAQRTLALEKGNKVAIGFDDQSQFAIMRSDDGYKLTPVGDKLSFSFRIDSSKWSLDFVKSFSKEDLEEKDNYLIGSLIEGKQSSFNFS